MSYSVSNVLAEAGIENVLRWVPFDIEEGDLRNRVKNKMIRPTTIPQTLQELVLEQAIGREALRLAFEQHKQLAVELRGVQQQRTISEAFDQAESGQTLVNMLSLDMLVGSGGVLSHAPRRQQSMLMMIDAFQPEGITHLAVDSIFMMPQLGVLAQVNAEAATHVFERDCLIHLGTCISPIGPGKEGETCLTIALNMPDKPVISEEVPYGQLRLYPLDIGENASVKLQPTRKFDVGAGKGTLLEADVMGGVVGLVVDTRGRPLEISSDSTQRVAQLTKWQDTLNIYPSDK